MHKLLRIAALILAVMIVVVLAVAPASAAPVLQGGSGGNNGSGNGAAGMNNWQTITPGQTVEWVFNYTGNNDPANIELASNPTGAVAFNVFTDNQWVNGNTATPVGKGTTRTTTNTDTGQKTVQNNGDLMWSTASSGGSQRFHVQVYSTSQQPAQYWINATGAGAGSLTQFNANASNTSLQGQAAGTSTGANTSGNATTNAGSSTGASSTGTANAGSSTSTTRPGVANPGASQAPRTLPVTGGSDLAVLFAAAAVALITGGWLARRRTS